MSAHLDRLAELESAATPGPWRYREEDGLVLDAEDYHVVQVTGSPTHSQLAASAALIAESRNALPALIEVARALKALMDPGQGQELGGVIPSGWAASFGFDEAIVAARAALARLDAGEEKP